MLARPGSGKTERVPPESKKAARSLEDRIAQNRALVVAAHSHLVKVDTSKLRIGNLHSLRSDLPRSFVLPTTRTCG